MTRQPKRVPGESNPEADANSPMHVARESWMNSQHGYGDGQPLIGRAIASFQAWWKRRKGRSHQ